MTYFQDFNGLNESANRNADGFLLTEAEAALVSYPMWANALDRIAEGRDITAYTFTTQRLTEGLWDDIKNSGLAANLVKVFTELKDTLSELAAQLKVGVGDLIDALRNKRALEFFKAIRFNLGLALKALAAFGKAYRETLLSFFKELSRSKEFQALKRGAMKVDDFLAAHPMLKKVGGLAVAGLLIYIWLNMSFIGDLEFDMNIGTIALALAGGYALADLFLSPEGLMMLTLLASGFTGLGVPWLAAKPLNLLLALCYTLFKRMKDQRANKLKPALALQHVGG